MTCDTVSVHLVVDGTHKHHDVYNVTKKTTIWDYRLSTVKGEPARDGVLVELYTIGLNIKKSGPYIS